MAAEEILGGPFEKGDRAKVAIAKEELKDALMNGRGGWNPNIEKYLNRLGKVAREVNERGLMRVSYNDGAIWTFHSEIVTKVIANDAEELPETPPGTPPRATSPITNGGSPTTVEQQEADGNAAATTECAICLDREKDTTFNPCGHRACQECSKSINECHICRKKIEKKIKNYD